MAGYSRLYCIGGLGGFQGGDGINPILFQILVGDADRQWFESHYFDSTIKPLGEVNVIVPEGPDHPNALLDACIAFFPDHFKSCSLLPTVNSALIGVKRLDFDLGKDDIPSEWNGLREEARPYFKSLNIWEAILRPIQQQVDG